MTERWAKGVPEQEIPKGYTVYPKAIIPGYARRPELSKDLAHPARADSGGNSVIDLDKSWNLIKLSVKAFNFPFKLYQHSSGRYA